MHRLDGDLPGDRRQRLRDVSVPAMTWGVDDYVSLTAGDGSGAVSVLRILD